MNIYNNPNLSNLYNFMLIKNNYDLLLDNRCSINKLNSNNLSSNSSSSISSSNFYKPEIDDTLFSCFYYIKSGESLTDNSFKLEKTFKINFIEIIRNNKDLIKSNKFKIHDIENNLVNEKNISKKTLLLLCIYYEINIIIIENNVYYKLFGNDNVNSYNILIKDNDLNYKLLINNNNTDSNTYLKNCIEAYNFDKIIKSISSYKSDELKTIADTLNIDINKKNKNKIYEEILLKIS
tara:strand:+ start:7469 stop:8176 length:708 start_codon:yes stop_codon:yes gene_type:complete